MLRLLSTIKYTASQRGMSLVEVLLAVAIFAVVSTGIVGAIIYGQESTAVAGARERAIKIAEEGIEAVRNIKDSGFSNLPADGTYGLAVSGGVWALTGSSDTTDIFTRTINLTTTDTRTRNVTVNVNWRQTEQRSGSISLNSFFSDWVTAPANNTRHGMLVYGDGGNSTDAIKYQIYDEATDTWSAAASTADIDSTSTTKYLRAAKIYASSNRNEKVLVSRHLSGNVQWIYAQVFNGSTGSWGNVVQLSTWTANTFLDAQNFDAAYLANGDLMVVYSDFTTTPKFRIWNGTSWSSQLSMQVGQSYPNFITTKNRPGTNEVMTVVAGQGKRTETQYYNGAGYNTSNWTFTQHATNSTANTVKFADFSWSPNSNTTGALVYEINTKNMVAKIFTANGSGGGSWSSAVNSPTQSNNVMNVEVNGRSGANEFMACNKDNKNPQDLSCYEINSFTPTWATPVNNLLTPNTQNGSQYSIDFEYNLAGSLGLVVYSDNMSTPKYRTYSPSTNAFSAASTLSDINGILETVKVIPSPVNDDFMVLLGNASLDVFSTKYNSANNTFSNITSRAINGSAISDYWYDFVWDGM